MRNENGESLEDLVKLYYGETNLTEEEARKVDEMLQNVEESGFLEKCREVAKEKEKKTVRIGRFRFSKVACIIIVICIITSLGGYAYAAVLNHIKSIEVVDKGDHYEVNVDYNDDGSKGKAMTVIDDYYKPLWVPDGFHIVSESKRDRMYNIVYLSDINNDRIDYAQLLSDVKTYYGAENGIHENISFEDYNGEFVETEEENYLIVTDGNYIYSLIGNFDKDTFIKMLQKYEG